MDDQNPIDRAMGLRPIEEAKKEIAEDEVIDLEVMEESVEEEKKSTEIVTKDEVETVPVVVNPGDDETFDDIELARTNIKDIIEKGGDSLQEMIELAKQSESPRAFEVASTLMKTLLEANKDFVEISMRKKYQKEELIEPKQAAQTENNVTNNNLILSTKDLLELLNGEKNE